ncbi:pyridine nucleotide-disulphide oxidoreductase family protein [Aspergillus luchuensis]|uniref:Pyridine nucleotide-disulphide oxidoreductase family protein n=1 Tax=Aspergillus kawachii TaxID=1069201 RepID=A0A146FV57_ASPKA|nr:pyridine nucleotide-disulphide oxidoreductase family protein [Aspergillus luchuensis]
MAFGSDAGKLPKARPREGLQLRPLNVEKGSKRMALSQRRNLLFVACSHQIYVWEPSGSFQTLGNKPEMIITPVMKVPHASGYIAPASPHAINNILVDDLGRDEVLLLVTDSGNVCGYRVEAIFSALKRATENKEERPLDGSQVDPFFVEFVQASAWGLAIHKFARLIAVSANTGLITVFAFALVNPTSESSSSSYHPDEDDDMIDHGQTWLEVRTKDQFSQLRHLMPARHRTRNVKLTYTGHYANIPCVDFLNCDLDPNGNWMVSTDIDNRLLVWRVWDSLGPFNVNHFNDVSFKFFPETLRSDERGWSVIALDPRTFHRVKSTEEACGGPPIRRAKNGRTVYDLTRANSRIPNASQIYNFFPPAVKIESEEPILPDIFGADCCISRRNGASQAAFADGTSAALRRYPSDGASTEFLDTNGLSTATGNIRPYDFADTFSHRAVNGSVYGDNLSRDGSDVDVGAHNAAGNRHFQSLNRTVQRVDALHIGPGPLTTPEFLQFALLEALGGEAPGTEFYEDEIDYYLAGGTYSSDHELDNADSSSSHNSDTSAAGPIPYPLLDGSRFPILHFSQTDIRLIPHPFANYATAVCGDPLRQPLTHPVVSIRACDRFNMVKYVPEHGIVIAASQKGRAAVIALTESETTGLSFRIDWIVPLESQEKYGDRPLIPILGMSVSPIQGFEFPPDVPYIPRDVKPDDLAFQFKYLSHDEHNSSLSSSVMLQQNSFNEEINNSEADPSETAAADDDSPPPPPLSLPECHARASSAYQPEESWRGWNPSRHYRLMLMYADHTIMSYEFWYKWNTTDSGSNGQDLDEEDDILLV